MTIIKLQLMSKNNLRRGSYLYQPIVLIDGKYYWCESFLTKSVTTKHDISPDKLVVKREIPPQYYQANGITAFNPLLYLTFYKNILQCKRQQIKKQ